MNKIYDRGDTYRKIDALIYGLGTPEHIQLCKKEFHERRKQALIVSDPEISKRNLAALADCKAGRSTILNFEVTR